MEQEESSIVKLKDDFYRDSIDKIMLIIMGLGANLSILVALMVYLYLDVPSPIIFHVQPDWRVKPPVPLEQPYLSSPEVLQWVGNVVPKTFNYDFKQYNQQLKNYEQYFTADGWKKILNQLNIYANYNNVQAYKLFVYGSPDSAPFILKQGLLSGKYAWWVQMTVNIDYAGFKPPRGKTLTMQVLVVRVSTLDNLTGVAIDNVIVAPPGS